MGILWLPSVSPGPSMSPASVVRTLGRPGWGSACLLFSSRELLLEGGREWVEVDRQIVSPERQELGLEAGGKRGFRWTQDLAPRGG